MMLNNGAINASKLCDLEINHTSLNQSDCRIFQYLSGIPKNITLRYEILPRGNFCGIPQFQAFCFRVIFKVKG